MLVFKVHFPQTRTMIITSKYMKVISMLISHPCVTLIHYYP